MTRSWLVVISQIAAKWLCWTDSHTEAELAGDPPAAQPCRSV